MRAKEFLTNGGWSNPVTQNTVITPTVVAEIYEKILPKFILQFNRYLEKRNIPPVELYRPAGSATYYKRDLAQNPTREYGDVDVNLLIPRISELTNNANADLIKTEMKQFCENSIDFQTDNGTNVVFKLNNDYVQVDFITAYYENKEWTNALAPAYGVKGVLCNSLYSSLGEAINLSMGGGHGVQAKTRDGELLPFRTTKDVVLTTVTNDPKTWAIDIAKYLGCKTFSPLLKEYPGMLDEVRVKDIINSIKGIAQSLEMNRIGDASELLSTIKDIYLSKINKAINSSKFEKAGNPAAIKKAEDTKKTLASKSQEFASYLK